MLSRRAFLHVAGVLWVSMVDLLSRWTLLIAMMVVIGIESLPDPSCVTLSLNPERS